MGNRTIVPFGPQHPVLPEPIHLDLVVEDEKVVEAIPSIGFIHRGLEKLVEKRDYQEYVFVAERICGICSFIHGLTYCLAVEEVMKVQVPDRAKYLRIIWSELSRIHSHLLWLGLIADAFGFENMFMQSWRIREKILDIIEETTGGRVIFGSSKVGGVRKDISPETMQRILVLLNTYEKETRELGDKFLADYTVKNRLVDVGVLTKDAGYLLGAVGPMARASGIPQDLRQTGYSFYDKIKFEPIVSNTCDSWGRCDVRIREIYQSFDMIRQAAKLMEVGEIAVDVKGNPEGEFFMRTEQPRGEVVYYIKANGTKNLERLRVRTPTFANLPPLVSILPGVELADVPILVLTIDPCISCTER
ncbi:MAG: nickel-dependent hydrogenase large subunit [Fibrobacteres bacterium]|nr:nickel-dependent hydrogenase large subunit [Fibrobacterota bacterium]